MPYLDNIARRLQVTAAYRSARELSSFKGGGIAYVFEPDCTQRLIDLVAALDEENIPYKILGGGSNMLISDGICQCALISLARLNAVSLSDGYLCCEAGARISKIISEGRRHSLGGLEFLSGVPCSLGGALKMNAGAFSSQIGDYVYSIDILTPDFTNCDKIHHAPASNDRIRQAATSNDKNRQAPTHYSIATLTKQDLHFAYRKGAHGLILSARLKLKDCTKESSLAIARDCLTKRRQAQPTLPSLGCVFKNGKSPSGLLLDKCGLKGTRRGDAEISRVHANFIVNLSSARAEDYLYLAALAKQRVYESYGIALEEEFCLIT